MSYKIIVTTFAQSQIDNAYRFYKKNVSIEVAKRFKKDLSLGYKSLEINPFYAARTNQYRALPLKIFPFLVFFEINETFKEVKVVALFNTHQDPENYPQ